MGPDRMILDISELNSFNELDLRNYTLVDGSFDPLHDGHISYFDQAAELGNPVACLIAPEIYTATKHPVLLPVQTRAKVLGSLVQISLVITSVLSTSDSLRIIRPAIFFKGKDWADRLPETITSACDEAGTRIVFGKQPTNSSSRILENFIEQLRQSDK